MPKISQYSDGGSIQSGDQFVIARSGQNYSILGSQLGGGAVGGRLTLTSGTPIDLSDVTAATSIYWTPYLGDKIPLFDGTTFSLITQTELTLTLNNPNHAVDTLYDVFYFDNNGTKRIGTGPAWSSSAAGSSSRGAGAGTTELELHLGLYVNKNDITLRNGANTYSVTARYATYLGTFMTTSTIAQTEDSLTKRFLWNNYNRLGRILSILAAGGVHTYNSTTLRYWGNDSSNILEFIHGLHEDKMEVGWVGEQYGNVDGAQNITVFRLNGVAGPNPLGGTGLRNANAERVRASNYIIVDYDTAAVNSGYNYLSLCEQADANISTFINMRAYALTFC